MPTVEQPVRVAEFDELFATAVRDFEWVTPTRLRLTLDAEAAAIARDLAEREGVCCSFFGFDFAPAGTGAVAMEVTVPATHAAVLEAFAARAAAGVAAAGA